MCACCVVTAFKRGACHLKAPNQKSKLVGHCHGPAWLALLPIAIIALVMTMTTTGIYWAPATCQTERAKYFVLGVSLRFL